ncbi:MAG: ROK family protein [Verrucomicrobiota bacterium]
MQQRFLGIEIGGTKLQIVVGDSQAAILARHRYQVALAKGGNGIRAQIRKALPGLLKAHSPLAIGVGFGGPVDWRSGRICCSHQVAGWAEFELGAWLQSLAKVPVRVENDSNLATLGEATLGSGKSFNPVFYTNAGSGVGGGLVVSGQIYHGATPGEAELGHVRLNKRGTIVEQRCSGWAVDRRIRELKTRRVKSSLCDWIGEQPGGEARHLARALDSGDKAAQKILRATADDWAFALSHVVHLIHPQVIILGGGLSLIGEPLRAAVALALPRYVMAAFQPPPPIKLAGLGEDSVPVGALVLAATTELCCQGRNNTL